MAIAGVFSVWWARELVSAVASERNSGIQRPLWWICSMRSTAAGESSANHSPPSDAKDFCGAK